MKRVPFLFLSFVLLLGVMAYSPVEAACTCTVFGTLTLHQSCHETTLNLWVYDYEDPIQQGNKIWILKESLEHVGAGEDFVFDNFQCYFSCSADFRIKSKGNVLYQGQLPGLSGTLDVGTIYDPSTCGKKPPSTAYP